MEPNLTPGRRIAVVGTSGSGKTYVAEALGRRLGLTYICNDAIIWRANWQPPSPEDEYAGMDEATLGEAWTFDGNLGASLQDQLVLSRCDTLVWLDLPRWQVWSQVIRRTFWRLITHQRLWHDNVETWSRLLTRDSVVLWSIRSFNRRRRAYTSLFAKPAYADKVRIRPRSRREVNDWLAGLPVAA